MKYLSGESIRGYDLAERIGIGPLGSVYRAYQSGLGREVVLKIIQPRFANEPDFIRRFKLEAQLVGRLEHLRLVPLYDFWRDYSGAYLVHRWMRGGDLNNALREGPFKLESAAKLLDQIATGLAAAHRRNILHRNLKPTNILLDEEGNAYITDFAIARRNVSGNSRAGDQPVKVHHLLYRAPEQVRNELVTPQSDVYSLGVILYEALTGKNPFADISDLEGLYECLRCPLPRIESLVPEVREGVNNVLQRATASDSRDRHKDVLEMAVEFRRAAQLDKTPSYLEMSEGLTARELEILIMIMDGRTNKEIAQELFVEVSTVKWHITQLYRRLNVRSRAQAIMRAREIGLLTSKNRTGANIPVIDHTASNMTNPYKGLRPFETADEEDFFGREAMVNRLVQRMGEAGSPSRFLAIVGPSGSGKSSLVKAGLIPALRKGLLPGSERWFYVEMTPGSRPLDELETALSHVTALQRRYIREHLARGHGGLLRAADLILPDDGSELLILIDQFEEVFTMVAEEATRRRFLEILHTTVKRPQTRVRIVITLRADFYDRPLNYPDFGELVRQRMETVLPLSPEELEGAIWQPAQGAGVHFEPGLVATIIEDVHDQPGALPLMQYALTELFENRTNHLLTHDAYQAIGGTVGALARRAEALYRELKEDGQEATRQLFLRLAAFGEKPIDGEGSVPEIRRRVPRNELLAITEYAELMDEIVDTFTAYRLLSVDRDPTTRQPTVELAHEALLREWPRLEGWLAASREDLYKQLRLQTLTSEWLETERDEGFLLRETRLDSFVEWAATTDLALTHDEKDFVKASLGARQERQAEEAARQRREASLLRRSRQFLRALVGVFALATLIAFLLANFAFNQRNASQQNEALAIQNAATATIALGEAELQAALAASSAAEAREQQAAAQSEARARATQQAIAEEQAQLAQARELSALALTNLDLDPELSIMLALQSLSEVYTVEAENSLRRALQADRLEHSFDFPEAFEETARFSPLVSFNPDRKRVAFAIGDGTTQIFDTETGDKLLTLPSHQIFALSISFSPDGTRLGTIGDEASIPTVKVWDSSTGEVLHTIRSRDFPTSLAFGPDSNRLAIGSRRGSVTVWDLATFQEELTIPAHTGMISEMAFSPKGIQLVTLSQDGTVKILDTTTGEEKLALSGPTLFPYDSADFSPDGKYLATASHDRFTIVWNAETGEKVLTLGGPGFDSISFSPDGKLLATGGLDNVITLWNVDTGEKVLTLSGHDDWVSELAFTPDGRRLMTASFDETIKVWDISSQGSRELLTIPAHTNWVSQIALSPDGKILATASADGTAKVWELENPSRPMITLSDHHGAVWDVTFSPDGQLLATGGQDNTIRLWDVSTGERLWVVSIEEEQYTLDSLGPGDFLSEMARGALLSPFEGPGNIYFGGVRELAFSPDGALLAAARADGILAIVDVATGQTVQSLRPLNHILGISNLVFNPQTPLLASSCIGGIRRGGEAIILWDALSWKPLTTLENDFPILDVSFNPSGTQLIISDAFSRVTLWDLEDDFEKLYSLTAHTGPILGVAFNREGNRFATAGFDGNTKVWETKTGQEILTLSGHSGAVSSVTFSPDGKYLYTAGHDGTVRVYITPIDELIALAHSRLTR